jgi:hypothetical protein
MHCCTSERLCPLISDWINPNYKKANRHPSTSYCSRWAGYMKHQTHHYCHFALIQMTIPFLGILLKLHDFLKQLSVPTANILNSIFNYNFK